MRLNLVVAVCQNGGIGIQGTLPWRLKGDMAFFRKITLNTTDPGKKNAVLMGRKTWESIPQRFRPLTDRLNVVLSRTLEKVPEGVIVRESLADSLSFLSSAEFENKLEEVFIIGGSMLFEEALNTTFPIRLYYTRVMQDFDCDVFFPSIDWNRYQKLELDTVPMDVQEENGITYKFEVYDRQS